MIIAYVATMLLAFALGALLGVFIATRPKKHVPKLRRCEVCGGPGPCLWAEDGPNVNCYACQRCHNDPKDPFFARVA